MVIKIGGCRRIKQINKKGTGLTACALFIFNESNGVMMKNLTVYKLFKISYRYLEQ